MKKKTNANQSANQSAEALRLLKQGIAENEARHAANELAAKIEDNDRRARDQEARASQSDALPSPPEEVVIRLHPPAYQRKRATEFLAADVAALTRAYRSHFHDTIRTLREHGADLRMKAKKQAAWAIDADVVRLLDLAAHLDQAADLIDLHVTPDEDNG